MPERVRAAVAEPGPPLPELDVPPLPARHRGRWWRLGMLLLIVAAAVVAGRLLGLDRFTQAATLRATVDELRHLRWIAPAFVAAYALGASIGLPATPFTFTGAAGRKSCRQLTTPGGV